ncbi:uncharacterized protein PRCAT00005894001 [Priceomyces carsonii]|uniref:uncharacterized protein n=1 Tax=Priceomyces carsonii TaxID=28549 RepID=UPI002ED9CE94|nr:unnamed protein product [Priceomyces carsonii]
MSDSELDFDYDDDIDETDISLDSPRDDFSLKSEEIVYEPWTLPSFIQTFFVDKMIRLHEMQLPQCPESDLLIMLQYKWWEVDQVINNFYDDKNQLFKECGLVENPNNEFSNESQFTCVICCETYKSCRTYSLTCSHKFCINCYYEYLVNSLHRGMLIRCIDSNCSLTIPHEDIEEIISAKRSPGDIVVAKKPLNLNSLLIANAKVYIKSQKINMKWCPVPDCNSLSQLLKGNVSVIEGDNDISKIPMVMCASGHQFCFACQYENHLPCPCWIVKMWIKKCEDDSETANWIQANTQICPKCNSSIEKNGGCNHMTCSNCHYEFCWICSKEWALHGTSYYKCNKFDPEENDDLEKTRQSKRLSLQRYLHFYRRFAVHESSMNADKRTLDKVNNRMKQYMEAMSATSEKEDLSWIDIQYLHDAVRSLTNGRKTLKWTYCFAFYLGNSNFSEIFEQNQEFLNKSVEDLSEIFETINHKKNKNKIEILQQYKPKMINLSKLVSLRQQTLIDGAECELNQGLLYFET